MLGQHPQDVHTSRGGGCIFIRDARGFERAQARALRRNMWPENMATEGGAIQLRCRASPATAQGYTCCCFLLSLGGFPLGERKNMCSAIFEVYEASTLKRPTKRKKYRAECPIHFVFEFWSKSEYPYSASVSQNMRQNDPPRAPPGTLNGPHNFTLGW